MQYLRNKFHYLAYYFATKIGDSETRRVTKYDIYFEEIYKILNWNNNTVTLGLFLFCNFLFWLILWLDLRPLSTFFTFLLGVFLLDSIVETRNYNTYHLQYSNEVDEIYSFLLKIHESLLLLRNESPSSFSLGAFLFFFITSCLARKVSCSIIAYIGILIIFFLPLLFKTLPRQYEIAIRNGLRFLCNTRDVVSEEELEPYVSNKDFINEDTDADRLLNNKPADSSTNSLASGITSMPSYLDVAESQDGIEEDDLIPNRFSTQQIIYSNGEFSSDSDSEHRNMSFNSTDFKSESSSEEEKNIGQGLKFSDILEVATSHIEAPPHVDGIISNFASMSSSFFRTAIDSTRNSNTKEGESTSSESEFEIINTEEFQ